MEWPLKCLIRNIIKENEVNPDSIVKEYLTVQQGRNRQVKRKVLVYNLDFIRTQNAEPRTQNPEPKTQNPKP